MTITGIALTAAEVLALAGLVLFFKPLLSGIVRAVGLMVRLKLARFREQ